MESTLLWKQTCIPLAGHRRSFAVRCGLVTKYGLQVVIRSDLRQQVDTQDFKMALVMPVKEKKLMDIKIGAVLPSWILMQGFTPKGTIWSISKILLISTFMGRKGAFLRFLRCWQLPCFNCCLSYKEVKCEWWCKCTEEGIRREDYSGTMTVTYFVSAPLPESFHILNVN